MPLLRRIPAFSVAALVLACGETGAATGTTTATAAASEPARAIAPGGAGSSGSPAPHPLPDDIVVDVFLPGRAADQHLSARIHLGGGLPWEITGCVTPGAAPCEETMRVGLDEAARGELVEAIEAIRAIPLCEPEGTWPDDRRYELTLTGFPRPYVGHLPADAGTMASRNDGPCRADARLAWWIATHFDPAASGGSPTTLPLPSVPES